MPNGTPFDLNAPLSPLTPAPASPPTPRTAKGPAFWIEPPSLPDSVKKTFFTMAETFPPSESETESIPEEPTGDTLDEIIGEYRIGTEDYYYARYQGGIARKYLVETLTKSHPRVVANYKSRVQEGNLPRFDPSTSAVHPNDRVKLAWSVKSGKSRIEAHIGPPGRHTVVDTAANSSAEDSASDNNASKEGEPDSESSAGLKIRITRSKAVKQLPFSPRRTHSRRVRPVGDSEDEGDASSDSFVPRWTTRSTAKAARTRLGKEDSDDFDDDTDSSVMEVQRPSKKSKKLRARKGGRPVYGEIRDVVILEEDDDPMAAHRENCEKCARPAAHLLPPKKKSRRRRDEFEVDSDDEQEKLGGWVRCLKCPVVAHWGCLSKAQHVEILKAVQERQHLLLKAQQPDSDVSLPNRLKLITAEETTEFLCAWCVKGGVCMGCKDVALESETTPQEKVASEGEKPPAVQDDQMDVDRVPDTAEQTTPPTAPNQLLFRCLTCKGLAHYAHLPNPPDNEGEDNDVAAKAEHYQQANGWLCPNCQSYSSHELDVILAWRPIELTPIEAAQGPIPNPTYKTALPREYLVKWEGCSYRRLDWVSHMWLLSTHPSKLRHFFENGSRVELLKEPVADETSMDVGEVTSSAVKSNAALSATDPRPEAERMVPVRWKVVDRVLDVLLWSPNRAAAPSKRKGKRGTRVASSDEEEDIEAAAQTELDAAFNLGKQPSQNYTETVEEWERRTKRKFSAEQIDMVVWAFFKWDDLTYEQATWDSPPRVDEDGYSAFSNAFNRYIASRDVAVPVYGSTWEQKQLMNRPKDEFKKRYALKSGENLQHGQDENLKLMPFQIDGFNWLCDNWWNRQNCILADEMGLGKTVQIAAFLGFVIGKMNAMPALIVVPNSTITNWIRELERWAPGIRAVPLYGEDKNRRVIKQYELKHAVLGSKTTDAKFHVLVTTYETLTNPKEFTSVFKKQTRWEALVVDEGQRLKSDASLLFKKLNELQTGHRVIMTGTPLNNNVRELFNLMNFLDPAEWKDLEALSREYEVLDEERVKQLHHRLRPYFLRRIKSEVLTLPPKNEVIVPVSMTPIQQEVYRSILKKNVGILKNLIQQQGGKAQNQSNPKNMLMQLRKCLQHPYLYSPELEPKGSFDEHERLIGASAKLGLLKPLLAKLKARGHRVLLFSQFVIALDIIEDFLAGEGYKFLRLDGNVSQHQRQRDMDKFNAPGSDFFVFMLTTRAGGVGINLWSADTVIIFDPDFNPHQDLQAVARAHRFGQTKTCLVFKLVVTGSAEERIMQIGKKKLVLDHLIVQTMDDDEEGGDIQSMITYGAEALFGVGKPKEIVYSDADIDQLIDRTEKEPPAESSEKSATNQAFSFAKIWSADHSLEEFSGEPTAQNNAWAETYQAIISSNEEQQQKEEEARGRGARRRATVHAQYVDEMPDIPRKNGKQRRGSASSEGSIYESDLSGSVGTSTPMETDSPLLDVPELSDAATAPSRSHMKKPLLGKSKLAVEETLKSKKKRKSCAVTKQQASYCGLCRANHDAKKGSCLLVESSNNLAEYRQMLMLHANDESDDVRMRAINAIEVELKNRGDESALNGQPLHFVPSTASKMHQNPKGSAKGQSTTTSSASSSRPAQRADNAQGSTSKRPAPVKAERTHKPKKVQTSRCQYCDQTQDHPLGDCPIVKKLKGHSDQKP